MVVDPSFGACAPPSPNSWRNLYFLRRVGRLSISRLGFCCFPQSGKTFCFPVRLFYGGKCSHLADFILNLGEMPLPWDIVINWNSIRQEVSALGGVYLSFELNWEECRCREMLLSIEIQYGKEGLPQIWNKCGWNNKSRSINWLSDILSLILNETIKAVLKLIVWYFIAYF